MRDKIYCEKLHNNKNWSWRKKNKTPSELRTELEKRKNKLEDIKFKINFEKDRCIEVCKKLNIARHIGDSAHEMREIRDRNLSK